MANTPPSGPPLEHQTLSPKAIPPIGAGLPAPVHFLWVAWRNTIIVPLLIQSSIDENDQGYADNTIVWEPAGLPAGPPAGDTAYSVIIDGVVIVGRTRTFSYEVTIITPNPIE
jgi:hypothetical protein